MRCVSGEGREGRAVVRSAGSPDQFGGPNFGRHLSYRQRMHKGPRHRRANRPSRTSAPSPTPAFAASIPTVDAPLKRAFDKFDAQIMIWINQALLTA